jgi:hypothetical protein
LNKSAVECLARWLLAQSFLPFIEAASRIREDGMSGWKSGKHVGDQTRGGEIAELSD